MKKLLTPIFSIAIGLVLLLGDGAFAATFQQRIESQQLRINRGIASGELHRNEAVELQKYLNRIKARYAKMTATGISTPSDKRILDQMLNKSSRMIYEKRYKHTKKAP